MLFILLLLMCLSTVYGGSPCTDRRNIYPCICIDRSIGKSKFDTTVICQGLENAESFLAIQDGLNLMEINKVMLYDSYWATSHRLQQVAARVPVNVLNSFKIEELEIVDTSLSTFACSDTFNCKTNYLKRYTAINSTMKETTSCSTHLTINSWINCLDTIESVKIEKGYTNELLLKPEFFPQPLSKLKFLHMPNNFISKVDKRTFTHVKFPALNTLNLSHNLLRDARTLFSSALKLKILDLSYNSLRTAPDFQYLPQLHTLKLNNNQILTLLENDWRGVPQTLRVIDLSNLALECNCGMKWVNGTLHINAVLQGTCAKPLEVEGRKIRRASRLLIERCDSEGKILASKIKHNG